MDKGKINQSKQNKSGINDNDDVDDLKQFIDKNNKQKKVLEKILKKINHFPKSSKTYSSN